jgi:hypothetical protein
MRGWGAEGGLQLRRGVFSLRDRCHSL